MALYAQYRALVTIGRDSFFAKEHRRVLNVFLPKFETILEEGKMARGLLLWLLGVPIPIIILLWLFFGH
ncbi:MAG: hypothetical protein ACTHM2_06615 [Afipia sp.]